MILLARDKLIKTGPVDYAEWNYRPFLGQIQRFRFSLALSLLPVRSSRLLEIGYGSGIFLPALKERASELFGVDIHQSAAEVQNLLSREGVTANLSRGRAEDLPFSDGLFDTVVAVSSLEFVADLDKACLEVRRVLKPRGSFIVVTPGHSRLVDAGLWLLTGKRAKNDFGNRRNAIIATLVGNFSLEATRSWPPFAGKFGTLYRALRFSNQR